MCKLLLYILLFVYQTVDTLAYTECGIKGASNSSVWRIVGGTDATQLEYPWMGFFGCGASIISDQWMITAGHCADPKTPGMPAKVLVGEHDIMRYIADNGVPEPTSVWVNVSKVFRPLMYENNGRPKYDISLIKLREKLDLNGTHKQLRPICMPNKSMVVIADLKNHTCVVTGWGKTRVSGEEPSSLPLQQSVATIIDAEICYSKYPKDYNTDYAVCAGDYVRGGHGACSGDSGSPLQCEIDGKWYLIGTVSWAGGESCANAGWPDVYAFIPQYIDWIHAIISNN